MRDGSLPASVRVVFALGIVTGGLALGSLLVRSPAMAGVNFEVYYRAGATLLEGGDLYAVAAPGFPSLPYVYPPVVAVVFLPALVLGDWTVAYLVFTVGNVLAAGALGVAALHVAAERGALVSRREQFLVIGFCTVSAQMLSSIYFGNVNPLLALAIGAGVVALDRGRDRVSGALFGVPAVVKVFPAAFGAYLLWRRSWRAVTAAVAVGVGAGVLSFILFGIDPHVTWIETAVLPRGSPAAFAGGLPAGAEYLTLRRPLSLVVPTHPGWMGPLAVLLMAPVVIDVYRHVDPTSDVGSLLALHTVLAAVLVVLPSYQVYYVYLLPSLVPLLLCLPAGPGRRLVVVGAALGTLTVQYPDVAYLLDEPTVVGELVLTVAEPVLTVGTPPLYGILLTLAGCVLLARRRAATTETWGFDVAEESLRRW
ncbi:MAG: glycosyltransferase family 87 protein [Halobacteriaceae archaeon]